MRLPKVLALATATMLTAGTASAVALGPAAAGHRTAMAGPAGAGKSAAGGRAATEASGPGPAGQAPSASVSSGATRVSDAAHRIGGGLARPASGVPVAGATDPALPSPAPAASTVLPPFVLPTPSVGHLPRVGGLSGQVAPDAVVLLDGSLTGRQRRALAGLHGVTGLETVDSGTVAVGGDPVVAFGVDPGTFRRYTPAASSASDQLWRYLAGGSLVSSYTMAHDRGLHLGTTETVTPAGSGTALAPVRGWLGAIASIGLPGVDLLVDHRWSAELGLVPGSGVVVAAPGLSGTALRSELTSVLPGATVELLHTDQVPDTLPGDAIGSPVRQSIVAAALSRVGSPYVWGAAGPSSFDCSGLVQWAYRQAGILMPRVAAEQYLTGDHIPLADAQPGDLLFWTYDPSDPGYVDHVAIYLGHGMMVVAPHTGTDVQVTAVPTDQFAGAVSVVLASR